MSQSGEAAICGAEGIARSTNREDLLKSMNPEQREKFLQEEAQAKAHQDLKTKHVLKTTGLFRGGGNPLKNGGGRGGRGGGGGATSRARSATTLSAIPTPPVFMPEALESPDPLAVATPPEPEPVSSELPSPPPLPPAPAPKPAGGALLSSIFENVQDTPATPQTVEEPVPVPSQAASQPAEPQHTRNNNLPARPDEHAEMLASMNPEQREAYLLEQAKLKEHEDSRTRHVLKTTGLFRAPGGNPLKNAGGRGGKGRRTSSLN